jgi:uncharacterized membrane protein YgaE (UPF0421/DUF939 family)
MPGGAAETRRPSWRGAIYHGVSAGLVAAFSFSTASLVPSLREPYWAPIAAVVVLYPARDATRRAAVERFIGTTIGSLIGWATADWWHQNLALYGLSVVVAVGLCYALRLENAARLCAVTVTVITLIPRAEAAYLVAFHRFVEVSYGVACALAYTMAAEAIRLRCKSGDAKA